MSRKSVILSTRKYGYFAELLARQLDLRTVATQRKIFRGGERYYRIVLGDSLELIRHDAVFVGSTHPDEEFLELLKVCNELIGAGGINRLVVVMPFCGYTTMDRGKIEYPIEVVSAKANAKILSRMLPRSQDYMLQMDLHTEGLPHYSEGYRQPFPLTSEQVLMLAVGELGLDKERLAAVSVDLGRPKSIKRYAKHFGIPMALVDKDRDFESTTAGQVIGNVKGKTLLMCDDMIRTVGSAVGAAKAYMEQGAEAIYLVAPHFAITDRKALELLVSTPYFRKVITTNSHPMSQHPLVRTSRKFIIKDVSHVFANVIRKILELPIHDVGKTIDLLPA